MNTQSLLKLKVDVPNELIPLIPGYLKRREEELEMLISRLEARDFEAIHLIAHKLTGNGAGYGMPALTVLGRELGLAAKTANSSHTMELIVQLREVITELKHRLIRDADAA